eukprot:4098523-Amphidinium_carterae.2
MGQKTKLVQEAVASRDSLREELVEVYACVRRLPKEELPLTKEGPRIPASFAVLESGLVSSSSYVSNIDDNGCQLANSSGPNWLNIPHGLRCKLLNQYY